MNPSTSANVHYDYLVVAISFLIATFASYVALDLAKRVRTPDRAIARGWWVGGSITMGTGIWSMHFIGMLAAHSTDRGHPFQTPALRPVSAAVRGSPAMHRILSPGMVPGQGRPWGAPRTEPANAPIASPPKSRTPSSNPDLRQILPGLP